MELTEQEKIARDRVCLALDVPTVDDARALSKELADVVGTFKVGKQLHTAAGNESSNIVEIIYDNGGQAFLDLKLHDTPNTVRQASAEAAVPGVYMFNLHIAGGETMCKKAIEGAYEGAQSRGLPTPKVIGVTVLTSLEDSDLETQGMGIKYDDLVLRRTELALKWGLDGIVCPANKAGDLEKTFGEWLYVTPGIKWAGKQGAGQKQLYTPDVAVKDCKSSILVVGSAMTKAEDKKSTGYEILQAMAKHL